MVKLCPNLQVQLYNVQLHFEVKMVVRLCYLCYVQETQFKISIVNVDQKRIVRQAL